MKSNRTLMNLAALMALDHASLRHKAAGAGAPERRNSPDLAATIARMADGLEAFKREQRSKLEELETRIARPGWNHGPADPQFRSGAPGDPLTNRSAKAPSPEEIRAFGEMLRTGNSTALRELRGTSINTTTTNEGLEAVVPWFDQIIRSKARDLSPLLRRVSTSDVGNFPAKHVVGDSTAMGSGWNDELTLRSQTDTPAPRVVTVNPGEWYALPSITEWALTDVAFDVVGWLQRELVLEYAETVQAAIVAGNGTNKPLGFLAGTPSAVTDLAGSRPFGTLQYLPTGQASTLPTTTSTVIDFLIDVVHSLRAPYRTNATWAMATSTMAALRKFKDADGRPILMDSLITGQPSRLMGYEVDIVESMPAIAAGAFPIAFGDFNAGYTLDMDKGGLRITRDDITTKGYVKFYARCRVGGKVLDSDAIKLVKVAAS